MDPDGAARLAPRRETRPPGRALCVLIILGLAAMLGACGDPDPLYGPGSPRDGAGRPVDPIYGTPLPGYPIGGG